MSLYMSLTSEQYHSRPMAISSITSPMGAHSDSTEFENDSMPNLCSSPFSSSSEATSPNSLVDQSSKPSLMSPSMPSFPGLPDDLLINGIRNKMSILPQPSHTSYFHPYHRHYASRCTNKLSSSSPLPPSLHERRLRNKTASAKYRAKKNQQHEEMRTTISILTKENELLIRQFEHARLENSQLKTTCDRLRGRMMAQRMLKQYLVENDQQNFYRTQQFPTLYEESKKPAKGC